MVVHCRRDGPETRDRNRLDHTTDVERRARRARQGAGRGVERVAEPRGVDGQIRERRYPVHRRGIDDPLELGRGVGRRSKPHGHDVLGRESEVAVLVLDRHLDGGRDRIARQPVSGLREERKLGRRPGEAGGGEGYGRQGAGSGRDGVRPDERPKRPAAGANEPSSVARVLRRPDDAAAPWRKVDDHTGHAVTVLVDDLDDGRRNAGRHRTGLRIDRLLDELRRRARQGGRGKCDRGARKPADRGRRRLRAGDRTQGTGRRGVAGDISCRLRGRDRPTIWRDRPTHRDTRHRQASDVLHDHGIRSCQGNSDGARLYVTTIKCDAACRGRDPLRAECQCRKAGRGRAERVQAGKEAQGPGGRPRDPGGVSRDGRGSREAAASEADAERDRDAANRVPILVAHTRGGVDGHRTPDERRLAVARERHQLRRHVNETRCAERDRTAGESGPAHLDSVRADERAEPPAPDARDTR